MSETSDRPSNWWLHHGDDRHTGHVRTGSEICSSNAGLPDDQIATLRRWQQQGYPRGK